MEWELTDGGVVEVIRELVARDAIDDNPTWQHTVVGRYSSQAQARKLVEWLDGMCVFHSGMKWFRISDKKRFQCSVCQQELRRQVGLE